MTATVVFTFCAACGAQINEPTNILPVDRKPCQSCSSLARSFKVHAHGTLAFRAKIGMKQKRIGYKKPIYESVFGCDLHRVTGQWNKLTRVIDRVNNHYKEVIVNPESGEVLRHCDESLTEHVGRGSAKPKPP